MTQFVCVGPTLHDASPNMFDGFQVQAPAERGDLVRLALSGASAILLIDGLYGDRPSVSHKEILFVLSLGIPVLGASSLGALRAAECAAFGMTGVGSVFDAYHAGVRTSDSDVAVLHGPRELGWAPLSVSLVDIEATLDENEVGLSTEEVQKLKRTARGLHFSKRTWPEITRLSNLPATMGTALKETQVHLKKRDALLALDQLRQGSPIPPDQVFEPTEPIAADLARYAPDQFDLPEFKSLPANKEVSGNTRKANAS